MVDMIFNVLDKIQDLWRHSGWGKLAVIVGFIALGALAVLAFCGIFMPLLIAALLLAAMFFGVFERAVGAIILGLTYHYLLHLKIKAITLGMIYGPQIFKNVDETRRFVWLFSYIEKIKIYEWIILIFFVSFAIQYFSPFVLTIVSRSSSSSSNSEKK